MSNLSNLMISGSYKGLINLEDSTQPLASQSVTLVDLQDGLGNDVGIQINKNNNAVTITNGLNVNGETFLQDDLTVSGSVDISGSLRVHGDKEITGSVNIKGDVNVDGDITADTGSFDTINTRVLNVTIETASVIFSSGSNVLGDEITDRQDLIGQVVVSGSLGVEGNSALTGSLTVSDTLDVDGDTNINGATNISGSTIISGSFTNKQLLSSEEFKVIAPNDLELINIGTGQVGGKEITLQGDVLLFASGTEPSFEVRYNPGTGNQSSTWRRNQITFPSGSYGNAAKINVDGGKQYQFADSVNSEGILGANDNRTGIFFGTPFAFDGELIIGKDKNNNRTIIGDSAQVYVSSSIEVQSNLTVKGDISSSTIDGIGNVTTYSASVDDRLDQLELYSGSQNQRLNSLEAFTGSQETLNGFYNTFTESADNRLDALEAETSSLQTEIDGLSNKTGSYATTGSNVFNGSQIITGSVKGNVSNVSIASSTASFDCSTGNFFTVTLPSGSTHLRATNITPGQTISVKVSLGSDTTNVTTDNTILFPFINPYTPTQTNGSIDLLSFVSFDSSQLLGASIKRLV